MDSHQKQIGKARSNERIVLQCSIVLASGKQVGEGQVHNMSGGGCLVESSVPVKVGDMLQLRLSLPESEPSMRVSQAAVCWAQGLQFGVQFIGMEEKDRARLNRFVTLQEDPWARAYGLAQDCGRWCARRSAGHLRAARGISSSSARPA